MKYLSLLVSILTVFFFSVAYTQKSYKLTYDKLNDNWSMYENKFSKGKYILTPLKNKPKLNENDLVEIELINYNPFLYYVTFEQNDKIITKGKSSGATGIINLLSGGLSVLSGIEITEGIFASRGAEVNSANVSDMNEFKAYQKDASIIVSNLNNFNSNLTEYQEILKLLEREDITTIKTNVIEKLNYCKKTYSNPEPLINELYPVTKYHFLKAGVKDNTIVKQFEEIETKVIELKEKIEIINNQYSKDKIQDLIHQIENQKYSLSYKFTVNQNQELQITDDELSSLSKNEIVISKKFVINFYNRNDLKMNSTEQSTDDYFIRFYHPNKYWNSEGQIVSSYCDNCKPVVAAEGVWKSNYNELIPRNLYSTRDNDYNSKPPEDWKEKYPLKNNALYDWFFYDTNGVVEHVSIGPNIKKDESNYWKNELQKKYSTEDLEAIAPEKKLIEIPLKDGVDVKWTSGFYVLNSFNNRYKYSLLTNFTSDSIKLSQSIDNKPLYCIGSQIEMQFYGNNYLTPSINLGAAMDVWKDRDVHLIFGGGLKLKKFPYLGLSSGISFIRTKTRNDINFPEGFILNEMQTIDNFIEKKYKFGYYFGITVNL
jgi:hypothetical protein